MKIFQHIFMPIILVFLVSTVLVGRVSAQDEITVQADELWSLLESLPYTPEGDGPPIYVLGFVDCPFCQQFYNDSKGKTNGVEMRRILYSSISTRSTNVAAALALSRDSNDYHAYMNNTKKAPNVKSSNELIDAHNTVVEGLNKIDKILKANHLNNDTIVSPSFFWKANGKLYGWLGYNPATFAQIMKDVQPQNSSSARESAPSLEAAKENAAPTASAATLSSEWLFGQLLKKNEGLLEDNEIVEASGKLLLCNEAKNIDKSNEIKYQRQIRDLRQSLVSQLQTIDGKETGTFIINTYPPLGKYQFDQQAFDFDPSKNGNFFQYGLRPFGGPCTYTTRKLPVNINVTQTGLEFIKSVPIDDITAEKMLESLPENRVINLRLYVDRAALINSISSQQKKDATDIFMRTYVKKAELIHPSTGQVYYTWDEATMNKVLLAGTLEFFGDYFDATASYLKDGKLPANIPEILAERIKNAAPVLVKLKVDKKEAKSLGAEDFVDAFRPRQAPNAFADKKAQQKPQTEKNSVPQSGYYLSYANDGKYQLEDGRTLLIRNVKALDNLIRTTEEFGDHSVSSMEAEFVPIAAAPSPASGAIIEGTIKKASFHLNDGKKTVVFEP